LNVAENQGQARLPAYSLIHFGLADVLFQWNNLDEAGRHLDLGFELLEQNDDLLITRMGHIILAQLKRARGGRQDALQNLQKIEIEAQKKGMTTLMDEVGAYRARLQAELGNAVEAIEWSKTMEIGKDEPLGYRMGLNAIQLARVFIGIGKFDEALSLLSRIEHSAEATMSTSWLIEAIVLQAMVRLTKGDTDKAKMLIEKALHLAIPEEHMRIFLDEGEPMRALIADYRAQIEKRLRLSRGEDLESMKRYTTKLLLAFPKAEIAASKSVGRDQQSTLIEPLSRRELEILRLVADGNSNQQIADTLIIATGTVKKHLNNIFGKLGAQSRTQCVARARELNLL
jgi:LuxR family maltose regulon positive regulatory protein